MPSQLVTFTEVGLAVKKTLLGILITALTLSAQSATVYVVPSTDAVKGIQLQKAMRDAEKEFNTWKENTTDKILKRNCVKNDTGVGILISGVCYGSLNYTEDFKFAVPVGSSIVGSYGGGGGTLIPLVGAVGCNLPSNTTINGCTCSNLK